VSRTAYVLLPPSESKETGGHFRKSPGPFDDGLGEPRSRVLGALATLLGDAPDDEISRILKVRGPLLNRALEASRLIIEGTAATLPAYRRYTGVVWSHLQPSTLSPSQRRRILIPSGLYGLSSGTDEIVDYRLTLKVALGELGNLTNFWRQPVTRAMEELPRASFINLLPKEHNAVLASSPLLTSRMVTITFSRHDGEGVAGHDAKAVKGRVARCVLEDGVEAVASFVWNGWRGRSHGGRYEVRAPRESRH
jgi:cytoplasmic iron level regulating protein YaaA (DUF328/UPF0246 family)